MSGPTLSVMDARTLILAVGAAARVWRLLNVDEIGEPVRVAKNRALMALAGPDVEASEARRSPVRQFRIRAADKLSYLYECPWCLGMYLSFAAVASGHRYGHRAAWQIIAGALTVNYAQAMLNGTFDVEDREDEYPEAAD